MDNSTIQTIINFLPRISVFSPFKLFVPVLSEFVCILLFGVSVFSLWTGQDIRPSRYSDPCSKTHGGSGIFCNIHVQNGERIGDKVVQIFARFCKPPSPLRKDVQVELFSSSNLTFSLFLRDIPSTYRRPISTLLPLFLSPSSLDIEVGHTNTLLRRQAGFRDDGAG